MLNSLTLWMRTPEPKNVLRQILSQQILLQAEEEDVGQDRGFVALECSAKTLSPRYLHILSI